MNSKLKIGIVGLGLIGGSLAKTIKRKYPDSFICACDTNENSLLSAQKEGVIDIYTEKLNGNYSDCDYIFLCAPVPVNCKTLELVKDILPENSTCIVSDTGSMKKDIHIKAKELGLSNCFIGGHPMAGLEVDGYENSNAFLFENVYFITTPEENVSEGKKETFTNFISSLDMIPISLGSREHDFATACVSHVPHIISAALVNLVKNDDDDKEVLKSIAAGGFKDITRISSSDPNMWTAISKGNKDEVVPLLDEYINSLNYIKEQIEKDNTSEVKSFFSSACEYRSGISNHTGGIIEKDYRIHCDLADEPGEIATIATRLAVNSISIKNIGIVHNREYDRGALEIEFYDAKSLESATELMHKFDYKVYELE
ncbi:MAG: prephenate dehydrogenase/arogenate dehydrogenase family protein [Eubacterium sp.]|nr:prephenate dehydrogenase/arogenate dehydrogenase family protein [Eubacterium sp.]